MAMPNRSGRSAGVRSTVGESRMQDAGCRMQEDARGLAGVKAVNPVDEVYIYSVSEYGTPQERKGKKTNSAP